MTAREDKNKILEALDRKRIALLSARGEAKKINAITRMMECIRKLNGLC